MKRLASTFRRARVRKASGSGKTEEALIALEFTTQRVIAKTQEQLKGTSK